MFKKIIIILIGVLFVGTSIIPGIQTNYQETMSGAITFANNKEQQSLALLLDYNYYSYIVAWGDNFDGQCNVPPPNSGFTAIAAGAYHSLGLKSDGSIVAWGSNSDGQCNVPPPNSGFTAIAGGSWFSLGLKSGSIVAWGDNTSGQCNVPPPNSGFTAIAGGSHHCLGLKSDGSIVAWGDNDDGQCNVPPPNSGFTKIAAGGWHGLGLKSIQALVAEADGPYLCTKSNPVSFKGSATGGLTPYTWDWNFGDGTAHSNQQNPIHQYTSDGLYTATLTVTDSQSTQASDTAPVTINTPSLVADAGGPYIGTKCNPVSFSGSATGEYPPYIFSWTFGDGGSGTGQNPTHQYISDGSYIATLTVTDNNGTIAQDTASVTISTTNVVVEANGPYDGYTVISIDFTGNASGGCTPYTWYWDFGDGHTSNLQNPQHTYINQGNYTIILTVYDSVNNFYNDSTYAEILYVDIGIPVIKQIKGGFGVNVNIINNGTAPVSMVNWSIDVEPSFGLILSGSHTEDMIDEISVNGTETIQSSGLRGIGLITITVQVADAVKQATAFLLGPLVLRLRVSEI